MNRIEEAARWVASLKYDMIPDSVRERVKLQLLGMAGAVHGGAVAPSATKLIDAVKAWDGGGDFPLLSTGKGLSLHGALFANAALSMAHDYDDYMFMGHTGHSAVFTSLLTALEQGASMEEMLTAITAANEVAGRFGATCLIGPQNGQVWTFIHLVGAAAAAAKIYRLDARKTAHAMAISLYQPNFALFPGFMGPDSKILSAAQTSLAGLMSAQLARQGFTGPLDIVENRQGFLNAFSFTPLEFMLSGWGESWVTDSIAYKVVPGCAYIDTAVDALSMVFDKFKAETGRDMEPDDARDIEVRASMLTTEMDKLSERHGGGGKLNPIAINFSIAANLAIMLLTGDLRVDQLDPDWLELHDEDILSICSRVRLKHDWPMSIEVSRAFSRVLDIGEIVDYVGAGKLLAGRRKAAKHLGGDIDLGLKDLSEMRKAAGNDGREVMRQVASRAFRSVIGSKRGAGKGGPPDLGKCDFKKFRMPFAAEVAVTTRDGKKWTARQDIPWGAPGNPWEDTSRRVADKFRKEARRHMGDDQINWVVENAPSMEKIGSVKELVDKLTGYSSPPKRKRAPDKETAPPRPAKRAEKKPVQKDDDLPPVIVEPVSRPAKRERPVSKAGASAIKSAPKSPAKKKEAKPGQVGVVMRKAKRGEKPKRPSKGAPRKRSSRP